MATVAEPLSQRLAWASIRAACRVALRRVDLRVEGLPHLPATGPVLLAARHYHHLYDGCALVTIVPRPLSLVVTLDWLQTGAASRAMTAACRVAGWPVVPRPNRSGAGALEENGGATRTGLRAATRDSVLLLRAGRPLLIFPEGYPTIDPHDTPKTGDDVLPFQPGFLRFVAMAERDGVTRVPIIPVGLEYRRNERWNLTVRFGQPMRLAPTPDLVAQLRDVEAEVRRLSGCEPGKAAAAPAAHAQMSRGP